VSLATIHPLDITAAHGTNGNGRLKPPLRLRGYVEDAAYEGILADVLETVSDVAWPTSVTTYHQMRRDAKLAAILAGYSQQLLRATWQMDGTGCRPEVVAHVAHDLDLTVQDGPQAHLGRTYGLSWHDHLRAALSMLPFGHAGFGLQAEIVDGRAHLAGLWDRPQHTISQIHVEPKTGAFTGISQELDVGPFDRPEIKADVLAWYCHEREGAAWFGTSLLRPAFAPWLLKREMQRVMATSSRRFGMGVPTAEFAPTANPTPEQFTQAQRAASAARVGDQSGLAMPPGAALKLVGLSGGVPDTLEFVKWLDQQMSTMALMSHLDLGQTQTGSRALGQAFIDSWTLSLESIGEEIADVVTRQVAARIVAWNWGTDELVPKVGASGIGSRREVTAESLQLLLTSGALSADPGLEEWVRREYRLPAPEQRRPVVAPGADTTPPTGPNGSGGVVHAARVWEQPELPVFAQADPPDDPDRADEQDHAEALTALLFAWPLLAAPLVAALAASAATSAASGAVVSPATLTVPAAVTAEVTSAVAGRMATLANLAALREHRNVTAQGADLDVDMVGVDTARLRGYAAAAVQVIVSGYRNGAARVAMHLSAPADVEANVRRHLDELGATAASQPAGKSRGWVAGELSAVLHTAQHVGRVAVFGLLGGLGVPVWWVASEVNDPNRCRPCEDIDGTWFDTLSDALAAYPAGKYVYCEGWYRCRGTLRARLRSPVDAAAAPWDDQPRAPKGTPTGGQWIDDLTGFVVGTVKAGRQLIYRLHDHGAAVAVRADNQQMLSWDEKRRKFRLYRATAEGWKSDRLLTKADAYARVRKYDWREPVLPPVRQPTADREAKTGVAAFEAAPLRMYASDASDASRRAISYYARLGYKSINTELRVGKGEPKTKRVRDAIVGVDKAMATAKLTDRIVVYRGVDDPTVMFGDAWRPDRDNSGLTWVDHGYTSASPFDIEATGFSRAEGGGGVLMTITVSAGVAAVGVVQPEESQWEGEVELMLERGLRFRVTRDHGTAEVASVGVRARRLDVEVVAADG
jgi:hypothetical protein